jgi:ABC-2 type transport system permease protein
MNLRRIFVLIGKEFTHGPKNLFFNFAVVIPVAFSLFLSLMAGSLFSDRARLGLVDDGSSALASQLLALDYVAVSSYATATELEEDVARGALDMGLVLPVEFDQDLRENDRVTLEVFIWGESLLRHRAQLGALLVREVITLSGYDIPVHVNTVLLGDETNVSWEERLFPMVVIMTIILGGTMVPATFIVDEKQKRTLKALTVTPVTMGEVLAAKGAAGVIISIIVGSVILTINQAWGGKPGLLLLLLLMSAVLAAAMGVILGMLVNDITTLFTAIKSVGILLYAPAFLYLFPQVPDWVMRIFPSYYMLGPIVEISLNNAGWGDLWLEMVILLGLILVTVLCAGLVASRKAISST